MVGTAALGAAGPRAHPRGPARRLRRRRAARPGAGRLPLRPDASRPAGTRSSGCCSAPFVGRLLVNTTTPGRGRDRSPARSSASRSPGSSSAPTCPVAAPGRCSRRCRSRSRPSSPATAGSRSPRRCRASGAPPGSSPSPTTRSSTCRWRRCCAGMDPALEESARSLGHGAVADLLPGHPAADPGRPARRDAARLGPHAGGVRRLRDAALPDLHDRDLRPVQAQLRRRRGLDAGLGPGPALPGAPRRGAGGARARALRAGRFRLGAPARGRPPRPGQVGRRAAASWR